MNPKLSVSLTKSVRKAHQPKKSDIVSFIQASILQPYSVVSIGVIIVDEHTSQEMNLKYRGKDSPTNVISLEYPNIDENSHVKYLYGDLILCEGIIYHEAIVAKKSVFEHYAHMIVHGMLHIQGYDHISDDEAKVMEKLEIDILAGLGFANPYVIKF
jgi:probable rRNA maturation factor